MRRRFRPRLKRRSLPRLRSKLRRSRVRLSKSRPKPSPKRQPREIAPVIEGYVEGEYLGDDEEPIEAEGEVADDKKGKKGKKTAKKRELVFDEALGAVVARRKRKPGREGLGRVHGLLMPKPKGPRPKHVPIRTCIACRTESGKRELVRIVRTPDGPVKVDPTGKLAGRGAYLCRQRSCWEQILGGQRLNAALKTTVSAEDLAALAAFAATLPENG